MTLYTKHAGHRNHGESTVHSVARCGGEEGLAFSVFVLDYCPMREWSKQMLIGCLGTGNTKARQLPDTVKKMLSLKFWPLTLCRKCLILTKPLQL